MKATIARVAKQAGKLLWIEMFVPGGTLIVLAILFAGILTPGIPRKLVGLVSAKRNNTEGAECRHCEGVGARPVDWFESEMFALQPMKSVEDSGVRL